MADYRLRLTLTSPQATPLHSGTLFGHLCWVLRYREGEQAFNDWLDAQSEQPMLISDALPAGYLPRPLLTPAVRDKPRPDEARKDFIERLKGAKTQRKRSWITVTDFLELRAGLSETRLLPRLSDPPGQVRLVRQAHNTIDRHTGTTPASGGLYFMPERWFDTRAGQLDVYVRTEMDSTVLRDYFAQIGEYGFGRDASLGRGQFDVTLEPADFRLFSHSGNRLLSLSHGVLTPNMVACLYKLHTHYGKLGGLYAGGVREPFKHPLTLTQPGLTFTPTDTGPYGALLDAVHPKYREIRQHAFHFCLPYTEVVSA